MRKRWLIGYVLARVLRYITDTHDTTSQQLRVVALETLPHGKSFPSRRLPTPIKCIIELTTLFTKIKFVYYLDTVVNEKIEEN